jgi:enediyne biosynthesis protein E4
MWAVAAPSVWAADLSWQPMPGGRSAKLNVATEGHPGFTSLSGRQTGVGFANKIDQRLIMENNNFMQGAGVALGDFDGDGWCDLYFAAIDGTNALYRNRGNWTFEEVTSTAGVGGAGGHSTGAVFADVDGDGDLDLLVNTLGGGTHSFLNLGGGRFRESTEEAGLRSRTGSVGLALGDTDGDGDLDLYVANYGTQAILRAGGRADLKQVNGKWQLTGPYADRLRYIDGRLEEVGEPDVLYLNDGRGRFKPVPWNSDWFLDYDGKPMPAPWDFGLGVQIRDLNEDGFPDIYVCNDFQTVDRVWINDGRGHFRLLSRLAMRNQPFASMGVDFADIDRDGRLDFLVVEMMSREHAHRMRQVAGAPPSHPIPGRFENRPEVARNTLFWNRGDGTYAEIANFAGVDASDWSWQPVFLDVDLDGFEDVLVVNGNAFDVQDRDVLKQVGALGRQTPEQTRSNILLYPRLETPNVAFRNRGDLTFEEVGREWGFDSRQVSHGIALADLDRDGDLDVVVNCLDAPPLLYRNDSPAPRVAVRLRGKPPNVQGIGARVKLIGGAVRSQGREMVSGGRYLSGDDPLRTFAAGSARNRMSLEVTWRNGSRSMVTNIEADRVYEVDEAFAAIRADLAVAGGNAKSPLFTEISAALDHLHREDAFDDYARQPLLMKQMSSLGPGVAWFDLDEDGHDDLFVGAGKGGRLGAFRGDGRGGFTSMTGSNAPVVPDDVTGLAGLVTADGRHLLVGGISNYENRSHKAAVGAWELNKTTGQLTGGPVLDITPSESTTGPLAVADYDGDGDLDIFVGGRVRPGAYPEPAASRLYRQEQNRLVADVTNQREWDHAGLVSGAVWSDLTGDGFPELIVATEWGPLKIFRNDQGKLSRWNPPVSARALDPRFARLDELTGWWNSVTTADLDGDGRLDLIAGSWGLNSPYHASMEQPVRLYYGDFAGRGVIDMVEAYFATELGIIAPRRSLAALSQAAPRLAELFPTHRDFGIVAVAEIFRRLQFEPVEARAATLASLVLLNRGDYFEAMPLPAEAQLAPVFGVTAADFDGDGRQDVFLGQNFFALRPDLPRLDAGRGLLLRGVGGGRLEAMAGPDSGVMIYGEQRGAAAGDFNEDGRPDLVVAQNGAATKLFRNATGRAGQRLRLQGPAGNPHGVGVVVRLPASQKNGQAYEVRAGSGYWSQDSDVLVLPLVEGVRRVSILWPGGKTFEVILPAAGREISVDHSGAVRLIR